jgi:hypothetical protein
MASDILLYQYQKVNAIGATSYMAIQVGRKNASSGILILQDDRLDWTSFRRNAICG